MMSGKHIGTGLIYVFGLIAAAECLLLVGSASGRIDLIFAVIAHVVLVAILAVWLKRSFSGDWTLWILGLIATALAGPLGAIGVLVTAAIRRCTPSSQDLLDEWYARMSGNEASDPASLICEAILTDRVVQPGSCEIRRFPDMIKYGTLTEKQALLGLIGLKYHTSYFPILALALRSPQPSVRAQAAAVFVKLKAQHKTRLLQSLERPPAVDSSSAEPDWRARAGVILECAESGFIDASEVHNASEATRSLCEAAPEPDLGIGPAEFLRCRALAAIGDHERLIDRLWSRLSALTPDLKLMLANSLIRLGRHRELHLLLKTMNAATGPVFGCAHDANVSGSFNFGGGE